jgi:ankyrin repeat protein
LPRKPLRIKIHLKETGGKNMSKKIWFIMILFFLVASLCAADSNEELARAVKNNNARRVLDLIKALPDVDMTIDFTVLDFVEGMEHSTKGTLLMWASYNGHVQVARRLIQKGADINTKCENGWTALMSTCRMGHAEVTGLLLRYGASVNERDDFSFTALMYAAMQGDLASVKLLIEHNAAIDARDEGGFTALMYACYNHKDIVKYLLEQGSSLANESKNGWNALYVAAVSGNYEIVKVLLENGARINKKYDCVNCGQTVLIVAAWEGYTEMAKLLMQKGALLNIKDDWGYTALDWAERKNHADVAALLKNAGAKKGEELTE